MVIGELIFVYQHMFLLLAFLATIVFILDGNILFINMSSLDSFVEKY